jgi:hypothetical protein
LRRQADGLKTTTGEFEMLAREEWSIPKVETKPDVFSLESLIAWLEKQPAQETYCYSSNGDCLLAQYFTGMGFVGVHVGGGDFDHEGAINVKFPAILGDVAYYHPRTFGAALSRARAALDSSAIRG